MHSTGQSLGIASPTSPTYSIKSYSSLQSLPESIITLQSRLKDDSIDVSTFGDLHLVDTLVLRRSTQDVMSLYLFDDALICVKPIKSKLFRRSRSSADLKLCGRILVRDMKRAYDSSTNHEYALTVDIQQGSFDIIFESKFLLQVWSKSLDMLIEAGGVRHAFHKSLTSVPSLSTDPSAASVTSSEISPGASATSSSTTANAFWRKTPIGHETILSGSAGTIPTYITTPSERVSRHHPQRKNTAVVMISDVSGFKVNSLRLTADAIAGAGFLVFVPDILKGQAVRFDQPDAWAQAADIVKRQSPESVIETIHAVVDVVRFKVKVDSIVLVGYGYGAQYAILSNATSQCRASVIINPTSFLLDEFYFKTAQLPLLAIVSPENEATDWVMRLRKVVAGVNSHFQFFSFSGTSRRFSLHPLSTEDESAGCFAIEDTIRFLDEISRSSKP